MRREERETALLLRPPFLPHQNMDLRVSAVMTKEQAMSSTLNQADGTIGYTVENLSQLPLAHSPHDYRKSDPVLIGDVTWCILLARVRRRSRDRTVTTLSFWVQCNMEQHKSWFCAADLEFRLVPQQSGGDARQSPSICWRKQQLFGKNGAHCTLVQTAGFPDFDDFDEICKPENGFVADDSVYVEVVVRQMRSFALTQVILPESGIPGISHRSQDFSLMLNNPFMSDVTFSVRDTKFYGHKYILSIRSPAMYDCLYMRQEQSHVSLKCDRLDPSAFLSMLSLIYCEKLLLNQSNLMPVFHCAMYFGRADVMHACLSLVTPDNVFEWCTTALKYDVQLLYETCIRVLARNADHLVRTEKWLTLQKRVVKAITVQDEINIREIDLFDAVVRWGQRQSQLTHTPVSEVVEDLISNIRFPTMKQAEFAGRAVKSQLLHSMDVVAVFCYFSEPQPSPNLKFSILKRRPIPKDELTISQPSQES